jgi:hypothetical protein
MDLSNQLVLHILFNAEKAWYRERLSIEAVSTQSNSLREYVKDVQP